MRREVGDYIEDIIQAMNNAVEFIKNMSFNEFIKDIKTEYAITRAIEIIREAVKNIPDELRKKYPDIPWRSIAGMRDKIIHAYF
ncbi:MAG: HepT-like ribonuclease domain-containing protein [Promethearchaeota archaeon]